MHIMSRSNYLVIRYILHIDHTYTIIVSLCLFMQMQFPNVLIMISLYYKIIKSGCVDQLVLKVFY